MNEFEYYFQQGMARALWVHAFMMWAQDVDPPPTLRGAESWEQEAPNTSSTRSASRKAAADLTRLLLEENGRGDLRSLFRDDDRQSRHADDHGTAEDRAWFLGEKIALAALGVADLDANHSPPSSPNLRVPDFRVALDDDGQSLTWDGGITWHRNPGQRWPASTVQSLLFSRRAYSESKAKSWARDHGFKYGDPDVTANYIRLRQFDPDGRPCRTVPFGTDIQAIVCATSNPSIGGPEVLLLDASPKQQLATIRLLKKALSDPRVIVADNVGAAIADMEVHEFSYILSDVPLLGRKNGIDFLHFLEQNYPRSVPGFLFFTDDPAAQPFRHMPRSDTDADTLRSVLFGQTQLASTSRGKKAEARALTLTPEAFAKAVLDAIPRIAEGTGPDGRVLGRFGRRGHGKVFIAAIWRQVKDDPMFSAMAEEARRDHTAVPESFKRMLIEANRRRELVLSRADLVGAMDPREVADSDTRDRGALYNFVNEPESGAW